MEMITKRVQIMDIMLLYSLMNFAIHYFRKRFLDLKHNVGTYETNKASFSWFDNKQFDNEQYIPKDGINTLAYGHKDI